MTRDIYSALYYLQYLQERLAQPAAERQAWEAELDTLSSPGVGI